MCLRDTGDYFSSLYAQLQHHVYADAVALLSEVMQEGMIMILDPLRGQQGTPFWCFCFDHVRYISAFADQTPHPVWLHDFRNADPFPGWGILDAAGALDAIRHRPGPEARNGRMTHEAVRDGYCAQIGRLLETDEQRRKLLPLVLEHVDRNGAAVEHYGAAVRERFAPGTAEALKAFGYRPAPAAGVKRRA